VGNRVADQVRNLLQDQQLCLQLNQVGGQLKCPSPVSRLS
jgi:hypothetical protein